MCKFLISCAVALSISGCVTFETPYQHHNEWTGGGFDELQLSENSWKVSFKATEFDDIDRMEDLCWLRFAELTINNGYKYFSVVTRDNTSEVGSYTTTTPSLRSSIEIVCYASKPAYVHSYSAVYLKKTIKAKYQIN